MSEHVNAPDLAAFEACAGAFAAGLRAGDVVALHGDLGAGKTTFVRAVLRALHGSDEGVSSPTFVFRQRYDGPAGTPPIEHLDLYRIEDPAEARELGLDEALGGEAVAFVEWPDRLPGFVPADARHVRIAGAGDGPRTVDFS